MKIDLKDLVEQSFEDALKEKIMNEINASLYMQNGKMRELIALQVEKIMQEPEMKEEFRKVIIWAITPRKDVDRED